MKPNHTWTWRLGVFAALGLTGSIGYLFATGKFHWWNLRGAAGSSRSADSDSDVAVEAMLSDAEATCVRELTKKLVNPAEATEAAAQIRDHLEGLIKQQSPAAAPSMALFLEYLAPRFPSLDAQSRQICLAMMSDVFGWFGNNSTNCWTALLSPSRSILSSAMSDPSSDVTLSAIQFVRACWEWSPPEVEKPAQRKALGTWKADLHSRCVELLHAREERIRSAAGVAVVSVPIDSAAARGLGLLHDDSPVVRRSILLALSDRPELLPSEDAVSFLRDPSAGVRNSANVVLTSRGLTAEQIALAQRATDPSPLVRAQAPRHIVESTAVDRVVWLTHLSRDTETTVRCEAARAMAMVGDEECVTRLQEMADADPDQGVRKLAGNLLRGGSPATLRSSRGGDSTQPEKLPALRAPKAN